MPDRLQWLGWKRREILEGGLADPENTPHSFDISLFLFYLPFGILLTDHHFAPYHLFPIVYHNRQIIQKCQNPENQISLGSATQPTQFSSPPFSASQFVSDTTSTRLSHVFSQRLHSIFARTPPSAFPFDPTRTAALRTRVAVIFISFVYCGGLIPIAPGLRSKRPDQEIRLRMHDTYPAGGAEY
jgi:hypothetical protein